MRQGSWFKPLKDVEGKLAGTVSNQLYILSDNISGLHAEVGRHKPRLALDGGLVHYYLLFDIFPFRFAVGFVRGVILND